MRPHGAEPAPRPRPSAWTLGVVVLVLLAVPTAGLEDSPDDQVVDAAYPTGCLFEGARYRPGQAVAVRGEPCVRCRCRRGAPVCRLRVCAPVPDPPPPGCVVLHRAGVCCPQLHCPDVGIVDNRLEARHGPSQASRYRSDTPNKGCYLNGSLFAEGSAMSSSTLCDYCYCVRGQQRCVRPQCVLPAEGCTPEYRDHTCCPTSYHCSSGGGAPAPATRAPPRRATGCTVDGKRHREGAQVKSVARGRCETCFCMRGRVRCAPLKCDLPLDGCEPVTAPGKCCPVSYDCSKSRVSITKTVSSTSTQTSKGSSGRPTKGENVVRSITYDARSNREISSKDIGKVKVASERSDQQASPATILPLTEDVPSTLMTGTADNLAITLNTKLDLGDTLDVLKTKNNSIIPEKNKILPVIEAIMNKTRQKDQDYDYDYNEPSLPPSLPNLRIIPFVAEDAVIPEDKSSLNAVHNLPETINAANRKESQDKADNFYFFSPPTETEGGFIPRQPALGSPIYQPKYDEKDSDNGHKAALQKKKPMDTTSIRTVVPDAVTPDPLLGNSGSASCTSGGRKYRHGELLTGMGSCRMCFCFDGGVVCQEPSCGTVPPGCSRAPAREPEQCCGSIVCGDAHRDSPLLFTDVPESELHRLHSKMPERPAVIEPVPDLVPAFTASLMPPKWPALQPSSSTAPPTKATSTSTTVSPPTSTTTTTSSTTPTTVKPYRPRPSLTTTERSTSTTQSAAIVNSASPILKIKSTTTKPSKKTASTTSKPPTTSSATSRPVNSNNAESLRRSTTPPPQRLNLPPTTKLSLTSTTTPAASKDMYSTTNITTTTSKPQSTTHSDKGSRTTTTTSTTTRKPPIRKERPTTTPTSLFAALWGSEDESTNEAQDKVDEDVQYHDLVSTNKHEDGLESHVGSSPEGPKPAEDDDSFSFDKFLELFIQPDPPVTTTSKPPASTTRAAPPPSSSPVPSTTTTVTPVKTTTPMSTTSAPKVNSSSGSPPSSTAKTTIAKIDRKPTTTAPPSSTRTSTSKTTTSPARKTTSKPVKPTTPKTTTSTSKPTPTTSRTTTTTSRKATDPTTTTARTTTARTTSAAPTSTTTTTTTTTTTPKPVLLTTSTESNNVVAAVRPSLLSKLRPETSGSSSSYPPQLHHMSTRRPPTATTPRGPPGLASLLKLAGCNIYGRMYRVGKIIQELSGPCLECRCTEVGVQCQQLSC